MRGPFDRVENNSAEVPEVLRTLAGVLPQFTGADLEAQLQTYDTFLGFLNPSVRPAIAALLREAATKTSNLKVRQRIEMAAASIEQGGCAAEVYNHDDAMKQYAESFRASFPSSPLPVAETEIPVSCNVPQFAPKMETMFGRNRSHPEILAKLDQIEAEMKKIGYWADSPPADFVSKVARGELKNYLEAPTFELWLQVVLVPRARQAAQEDKLPKGSQVGEMARRQYDYMSVDDKAATLLQLLQEFDQLIINA